MLALDMFALLPFLAPLLAKSGEVRASQENGERLLRQGHLVGVFPEGVKGVGKPFKQRYKLARFGRGGFVRLALRTGAPIIPCAVVGSEEIHPMIGRADFLGRPFGFPYFPAHSHLPLARAAGARSPADKVVDRFRGSPAACGSTVPKPPRIRSWSTGSPKRCVPPSSG